MAQHAKTISEIITQFIERDMIHYLDCGRRGIEKEGLRYTAEKRLSKQSHPAQLGSPLTHEEITTDYAESLLELVTPAFRNSKDTQEHLCYLHRVIAEFTDEFILNGSMPAYIEDPEKVEIGFYGKSNAGKMRRLYRKGLAFRYGKPMQLIAGIHFNYSLCDHLFKQYAVILDQPFNQEFINNSYMNLVRNIRRYSWLIIYLFGHSPALDKSFFCGKPHQLDELDCDTLYLPFATSLRMSDIGYQNKTDYRVSSNSLSEYIRDLAKVVKMPNKDFSKKGLFDKFGNYQQISTNTLQIENEFYTGVRPKQVAMSGEAPVKALRERGISYVELRLLDINCFERTGVSQEQLDFLELFMLFSLFNPSVAMTDELELEAENNSKLTAQRGRDKSLLLSDLSKSISIADWGSEVLTQMKSIAEAMDREKHRPHYVSILERQIEVVKNPALTPSANVMNHLNGKVDGNQKSYHQFITDLSQSQTAQSKQQGITSAEREKVVLDAKQSLAKETSLCNLSQSIAFEDYLANYFEQI